MADGACERVSSTNDVELYGVAMLTSLFGEVFEAFARVVVEAIFVEFEIDNGGG